MPWRGTSPREWGKKNEERQLRRLQRASLVGLRGVVLRSPVDTGRFRGNWVATLDAPDSGVAGGADPSGGSTISRGTALIQGITDGFSVVYLTNNLPYARRLEHGWSAQAPAGMVAVTMADVVAELDR